MMTPRARAVIVATVAVLLLLLKVSDFLGDGGDVAVPRRVIETPAPLPTAGLQEVRVVLSPTESPPVAAPVAQAAIARPPGPPSLKLPPPAFALDRADPHAAFGVIGGWEDAVVNSFVKGVLIHRTVTRRDPQRGQRYYTASRNVLLDSRYHFCRTVEAKQQPLRAMLNAELDLCYSPAAKVTVEAALPQFELRAGTREIIGVEVMGKSPPAPRRVGCQGMFVLRPAEKAKVNLCDAANRPEVSKDKAWADALRQVFGPLHLRLYLEGPEIVVGDVQFNAKSCVYYVHFRLDSPGTYHVNFKVQHSDFWGVDETHHRTRHTFNKQLLKSFPDIRCDWDGDAALDAARDREALKRGVGDGGSAGSDTRQGEGGMEEHLAARAPIRKQGSDRTRDVHGDVAHVPRIGSELRGSAAFAEADALFQRRWVQRPHPHGLFDGRILKASTMQYVSVARNIVGLSQKLAPAYGIAPARGPIEISDSALLGVPRSDAVDPPQLTWMTRSRLVSALRTLHRATARPSALRGKPVQLFVSGDSQSRSVYWALKNYLATVERWEDSPEEAERAAAKAGGITRSQQDDDEQMARSVAQRKNQQYDAAANQQLSFEKRDDKGEKVKFSQTNFFTASNTDGEPLVRAYYVWDSYLEDLEKNADAADVVIAGFGSHPASWGQWSFAQFAQRVAGTARTLCYQAVVHKKPVMYYGCPTWPKMKTVDNFRATNQRLAAFNGIAAGAIERECNVVMEAVASSVGLPHVPVTLSDRRFPVKVVDFFDMSTGLMRQSKDGSHYDGTVVVSTLAHEMLTAVADLVERDHT